MAQQGHRVDAIKDCPEVDSFHISLVNAYSELQRCKVTGFGLRPINIHDLLAYCEYHGIYNQAYRDLLKQFIFYLDAKNGNDRSSSRHKPVHKSRG